MAYRLDRAAGGFLGNRRAVKSVEDFNGTHLFGGNPFCVVILPLKRIGIGHVEKRNVRRPAAVMRRSQPTDDLSSRNQPHTPDVVSIKPDN